jgi:hypothetical protein
MRTGAAHWKRVREAPWTREPRRRLSGGRPHLRVTIDIKALAAEQSASGAAGVELATAGPSTGTPWEHIDGEDVMTGLSDRIVHLRSLIDEARPLLSHIGDEPP